jgi:hypothetical protein
LEKARRENGQILKREGLKREGELLLNNPQQKERECREDIQSEGRKETRNKLAAG